MALHVLMIGDVVGNPGLEALERVLPVLIKEQRADFVVVNGENAADGFGLTDAQFDRILAAGADVVTGGNHIWEKRDFWKTLESDRPVLRPANYPQGSPGRGWLTIEKNGCTWLVINLQGRELMEPIDCPFRRFDAIAADAENAAAGKPIVLVDFHAEVTEEKESLGHYIDGRAAAVAGTHTHIQTADERVLASGTAYITDLGMTGAVDSVIGMDPKICFDRARNQVLYRMECAAGPGSVQGAAVEIDGDTGKALAIRRVNIMP